MLFLCLVLFCQCEGNSHIVKNDSIHLDLLSWRNVLETHDKTLPKSFEVRSHYSISRLPPPHPHCCKILWLGGMNENQQWIGGGEGQVMTKTICRLKGEVSQVFWPGLSLWLPVIKWIIPGFFFSLLQFMMKQFYILHQKPCLLQVSFLGLCYSLLAHLPFFLALYEQYFSV